MLMDLMYVMGPRAATSGANTGRVWQAPDGGVFERSDGVFERSVRPATGSSSADTLYPHLYQYCTMVLG